MKKYFMLLMFCLFLIGCGKDYKTYSLEEKKEMIKEAVAELKEWHETASLIEGSY